MEVLRNGWGFRKNSEGKSEKNVDEIQKKKCRLIITNFWKIFDKIKKKL